MKEIHLTQGKVALIDDEDLEAISKYKWQAHFDGHNWYAEHNTRKNNKSVSIKMHRFIMNPPKDKVIDHINHNGLDNRKLNLRICTHKENMWNQKSRKGTSKYLGVSFNKQKQKWIAQAQRNGNKIYLGQYDQELDAHSAVSDFLGSCSNKNE